MEIELQIDDQTLLHTAAQVDSKEQFMKVIIRLGEIMSDKILWKTNKDQK